MKHKWFIAPQIIDGTAKLHYDTTKIIEGSVPIEMASGLSVHLSMLFVAESHDKEGLLRKKEGHTNDLFVATDFQTGTKPIVQRVHTYQKNQKLGYIDTFFKTVVFSGEDFTNKHITLHPRIFDIDDHKEMGETISSVLSMLEDTVGDFTATTPYLKLGGKISKSVANIVDHFDENDIIIDSKIRLEITKEKIGRQVLQTGHLVYFSEGQDDDHDIMINSDLKLVDEGGKGFEKCSYVVYSIRDDSSEEHEWEISQKVATLLSELGGKGQSGKPPIEHLRDTIESYSILKKLKRIRELEEKEILGIEKKIEILTSHEKRRLEKLRHDKDVLFFMTKR